MTGLGERPLRPSFGSNIMTYTFMDMNLANLNMVARNIREQVTAQEPRISEVNVRMEQGSQPGVILFDVQYTIISTNTKDNFVFPFYLNLDEEPVEEGEPEYYEPEEVEEYTD